LLTDGRERQLTENYKANGKDSHGCSSLAQENAEPLPRPYQRQY